MVNMAKKVLTKLFSPQIRLGGTKAISGINEYYKVKFMYNVQYIVVDNYTFITQDNYNKYNN